MVIHTYFDTIEIGEFLLYYFTQHLFSHFPFSQGSSVMTSFFLVICKTKISETLVRQSTLFFHDTLKRLIKLDKLC
uniref:Uncharacterized protein n=1 Tax=Pararge aegeria TaxID=116150 RepID=S4P803_9NEOP